ncbi:MAG: glucose-1-phosphate adenylyltransferase subunit GlgD [Oscillospiraceae bacterium]
MNRVIGLITANYETPQLGALTDDRTVASLPYGGRYRLIDFPLSNMINSGISTVGVVTPYKYRSIIDHIGAGKEWGLDRKNGGLYILPGSVFGISSMESRFLLRDFERNKVFFNRSPAPYVLVASSNVVGNVDYREFLEKHLEYGSDISLAYTIADHDDPNVTGLKTVGDRVTGITHGVSAGDKKFIDCFLISRSLLLNILDWYKNLDYLDLFEVLERDFDKMDVRASRYGSYTRSIFTIEDYYYGSMDLFKADIRESLFNGSPIRTKVQDSVPTKFTGTAVVKNSYIPAGCVIDGTVENSILFRNVRIEPGAVVRNCIVMQDCVIERDAQVEYTIIDRNNILPSGFVVKGKPDAIMVREKMNV